MQLKSFSVRTLSRSNLVNEIKQRTNQSKNEYENFKKYKTFHSSPESFFLSPLMREERVIKTEKQGGAIDKRKRPFRLHTQTNLKRFLTKDKTPSFTSLW